MTIDQPEPQEPVAVPGSRRADALVAPFAGAEGPLDLRQSPGSPAPDASRHDLEDVIDCILKATPDQGRLSVADLMTAIGERSFGPLILVPSLIALSPVGAIPGLPAITSVIIMIFAVQMLLGHTHVWLPQWLKARTMDGAKLEKGLTAFRPVARFVDHLLRPRLTVLTQGPFYYVIAVMILAVAVITPVLEIIPLGGIPPNAALVAFALAITAKDGLWALLAMGFTIATVVWLAGLF
jgi:hypothetical protein